MDELLLAMIKALPKQLRVQFVPAPDAARKIRAWIDEQYPNLPGTALDVDCPDLAHAFTQAAIATVGAQIHPEVLGKELTDRLSPYLRMTFAVEQPVGGGRNASGHGRRNPRRQVKVLGKSKDLKALQVKFAQEAEESARRMVKKQADKAADQGKIVQQANLLHRSGATTESRASMLWHGALDALRLPDERISSR